MNEAENKRNEFLPWILIAAGVLVLLANVGWFTFGGLVSTLVAVAQLWPVALIALGVDMLTSGKYRAIVLAAALVVGAALLLSNGVGDLFGGRDTPAGESATQGESITMPLAGAQRASVRLTAGVASVDVGVAPGSPDGVSGSVRPARGETLTQSHRVRGGVLEAEIVTRTVTPGVFNVGNRGGEWDLLLSDRVPLSLDFDGGVGDADLDLRGLSLTGLDVDAGVGAIDVTLPAGGAYEATIDAGVGEVIVRVPDGASVRFSVSTGLGGVSTSGGFERSGNQVYLSPDHSSSQPTANVMISGGVGSIELVTVR